jgi:HEAT repeat protein
MRIEDNNQPDPTTPEQPSAAGSQQLPEAFAANVERTMQELGATDANDLALIVADHDAERARTACWLLGHIGAKRHAQPLVAALRAERAELWRAAAVALSLLESKRAVKPLLELMAHGRATEQREVATYALAFMSEALSDVRYAKLISAAFISRLSDPSEAPAVRGQAAEGLGNMHGCGDRRRRAFRKAQQALLDALDDPAPDVRFWACFALGAMRARSALPALRRLAADTTLLPGWWTVGEEASDAIDWIEGRESPERRGQSREEREEGE